MASIEISNAVKSYGAVDVLHGIDLDIQDGEFIVLVGPSGCGKSTLLRMIAGLEDITSGAISIGGTVVNELQPKDRDIAMVFQSYALYPHMSVAENMSYALTLRKTAAGKNHRCHHQCRRNPWPDLPSRTAAKGPFGRAAPTRCHGARHCPQTTGLPV